MVFANNVFIRVSWCDALSLRVVGLIGTSQCLYNGLSSLRLILVLWVIDRVLALIVLVVTHADAFAEADLLVLVELLDLHLLLLQKLDMFKFILILRTRWENNITADHGQIDFILHTSWPTHTTRIKSTLHDIFLRSLAQIFTSAMIWCHIIVLLLIRFHYLKIYVRFTYNFEFGFYFKWLISQKIINFTK